MNKQKHRGLSSECPVCEAARDKVTGDFDREDRNIAMRHYRAIKRQERDEALRSLGLKKVRGALSGTYWE